MTDHNDVLDSQSLDGESEDTQRVVIIKTELVGNVTGDKDLAWVGIAHHRFRNSRIGASDPEDLGSLCLCKLSSELRLGGTKAGAPCPVLLKEIGDLQHLVEAICVCGVRSN